MLMLSLCNYDYYGFQNNNYVTMSMESFSMFIKTRGEESILN